MKQLTIILALLSTPCYATNAINHDSDFDSAFKNDLSIYSHGCELFHFSYHCGLTDLYFGHKNNDNVQFIPDNTN